MTHLARNDRLSTVRHITSPISCLSPYVSVQKHSMTVPCGVLTSAFAMMIVNIENMVAMIVL